MSVRAAVDVGSNSVKLLVLDIISAGNYRILADSALVTGLGSGLADGAEFNAAALRETADTVIQLIQYARSLGAVQIRAAGTSAMRRASNAVELINSVAAATGVRIEILSGVEEARLARAIALHELPGHPGAVVLFDVGGGSTELTCCKGSEVLAEASLELGARRCTDDLQVVHPVSDAKAARAWDYVLDRLAAAPLSSGSPLLAGLGGTACEIAWLLRGVRGAEKGDPHLAYVTLEQCRGLRELLGRSTLEQVRALRHADPKRAGVMYAGVTIIAALMEMYAAEGFILVDRGLRWGLLLADA